MHHPWLEALSAALADRGVATLRYAFPFLTGERRRAPDRPQILIKCVRGAVEAAQRLRQEHSLAAVPLLAGGKSLGGRMTMEAAAEAPLTQVSGLFALGFPLHPPGRPERAAERGRCLQATAQPLLIVQGSRDPMGPLDALRAACARRDAITLRPIEGADHGFALLRGFVKARGIDDAEVIRRVAAELTGWAGQLRP